MSSFVKRTAGCVVPLSFLLTVAEPPLSALRDVLSLHHSERLILINKRAVLFVTIKDYYEYFVMVEVFHSCPQKVCFTQVFVRHEGQFLYFVEFQVSAVNSSLHAL